MSKQIQAGLNTVKYGYSGIMDTFLAMFFMYLVLLCMVHISIKHTPHSLYKPLLHLTIVITERASNCHFVGKHTQFKNPDIVMPCYRETGRNTLGVF